MIQIIKTMGDYLLGIMKKKFNFIKQENSAVDLDDGMAV